MFYPSGQGNGDNAARVPAQSILDSSAFLETWSQNFSQTDLDEGERQAPLLYTTNFADVVVITAANIPYNPLLQPYSQADHNAALSAQAPTFHEQGANSSRRSSVSAAPQLPHLQVSTSISLGAQAFTAPSNRESCVPKPNLLDLGAQASLDEQGSRGVHAWSLTLSSVAGTQVNSPQRQGLAALNSRRQADPTAYNNIYQSPSFAGRTPVSRDSEWAVVASGGEFETYAPYTHNTPNVYASGYNQPVSQAPPYYSYPNTGVPTLAVSPVTGGPAYALNIDSPTPNTPYNQLRRTSSNSYYQLNMGVEEAKYPMSPPSERHRSASIATSASPGHSVIPSPIMSNTHSPQTSSEASGRRPLATPRNQEPPKNAQGEITCDHEECAGSPPVFRRRCEWNKHMDKHERPYKCLEPGCDKVQGFTYSGGLLRHQREVHKKNVSTRAPLYCPHNTCNRSTGAGFTRRENLNEHLRRRHNFGPDAVKQSSPFPTTPAVLPAASSNAAESSRKRKRTMEPKSEPEEEVDFDDSGIADTEDLREQIKRLRSEIQIKDRALEQMAARLEDQLKQNQQLQQSLDTINSMLGNRTHAASQIR